MTIYLWMASAFDIVRYDVIASQVFDWSNGQNTDITIAMNFNRTDLINGPTEAEQAANDNIRRDVVRFEEGKPRATGNITVNHHIPEWGLDLGLRGNFYKGTPNDGRDNLQDPADNEYIPSAMLWDVTGNYRFNNNWSVQAQILNIFDKLPPEETGFFGYYMGQELRNSEYGVEGTKWRLSVSYDFD